jgi:hypothetical protein
VQREFDAPYRQVVVRQELGVLVGLGGCSTTRRHADMIVERQPDGWVVFVRPIAGLEESGILYIRDDGSSFATPKHVVGAPSPLQFVPHGQNLLGRR